MHRTIALLAMTLLSPLASAQDPDVAEALVRYQTLRPSKDSLRMYALDWAPDLETALVRARAEERPILLVRIHAQYGDLFSGHC